MGIALVTNQFAQLIPAVGIEFLREYGTSMLTLIAMEALSHMPMAYAGAQQEDTTYSPVINEPSVLSTLAKTRETFVQEKNTINLPEITDPHEKVIDRPRADVVIEKEKKPLDGLKTSDESKIRVENKENVEDDSPITEQKTDDSEGLFSAGVKILSACSGTCSLMKHAIDIGNNVLCYTVPNSIKKLVNFTSAAQMKQILNEHCVTTCFVGTVTSLLGAKVYHQWQARLPK